jgi:tRNA(fMet)-specific endonuclease VapC
VAGLTHLLDSDVVVEAMRGRSRLVERRMLAHEGAMAMSSITVSELRYGAQRSSNPTLSLEALDQVQAYIAVVDFDPAAANAAGDLRAALAKRGEPMGPYDVLIAGQAKAAGLVLATGNAREFRRVRGLDVENWLR